jgi:hypothetical protein
MATKSDSSEGFTTNYEMRIDFHESGAPSSLHVKAESHEEEAVNSAIRSALAGKAMRARIVAGHRVSIETDHTRLNLIAKRLDENPRLTEKMRLDALQAIVKVRETLIKLERQAHQIIEQAPAVAPVAVQVNVNVSPHEAYAQMLARI